MARSDDLHIHYMSAVARDAESEWARNFAKSIMRQSRNPRWQPTPKQRGIMRRLVDDLFQPSDAVVVEED